MAAGAGAAMNRSLYAAIIAAALLIPTLAHTRGGGSSASADSTPGTA